MEILLALANHADQPYLSLTPVENDLETVSSMEVSITFTSTCDRNLEGKENRVISTGKTAYDSELFHCCHRAQACPTVFNIEILCIIILLLHSNNII